MERRHLGFVVAGETGRYIDMIGKLFIILIRIYQHTLAAVLGGQCRFHPTCSEYGIEAIRSHGAWRGIGLGVKRIFKCHPWHPGGLDPVPEINTKRQKL
jgi:putative membrane protein insertion efficiency factor